MQFTNAWILGAFLIYFVLIFFYVFTKKYQIEIARRTSEEIISANNSYGNFSNFFNLDLSRPEFEFDWKPKDLRDHERLMEHRRKRIRAACAIYNFTKAPFYSEKFKFAMVMLKKEQKLAFCANSKAASTYFKTMLKKTFSGDFKNRVMYQFDK